MRLSGLTSLLWLKVRHARTAIIRAGYYGATDIYADRSISDRLYQLYLALILAGCILACWVALLDTIFDTCAAMGPEFVRIVLQSMLSLPFAVLVLFGISYLRTPPLKLTFPDIAYLASSAMSTAAMALVGAAASALSAGAVVLLLGYVEGVGIQSALGSNMAPWSLAVPIAFWTTAAALGGWIVGLGRLSRQRRGRRVYTLLSIFMLCLLTFAGVRGMGNAVQVGTITVSSFEDFMPALCAIAVFVVVGLLVIVTAVARHVDMTAVIEENALYAEMYPLRFMGTTDINSYHDIRRRKRVAQRGPFISLPLANGHMTLVSRALLSHLRQFDRLPNMMIWSGLIIPAGATLLLRPMEPGLFLPWMIMALVLSRGGKEVTRVFRDDRHNRLIGDHLPFATLGLLVLDSLPALILTMVLSTFATILVISSGVGSLWMIPIAIVFNLAVMLCGGLDDLSLPTIRWQPSYDIGWFMFIVVMALLALADSPQLLLLGGIMVLGVLVGIVRSDS